VATAVSTVAIIVDTSVLVDTWSIGIEMTSGTVGLVHGCLPENDVGIVPVAVGALGVAAVIQWFVKKTGVHIDVRNPRIRRVAVIAFMNGSEVPEIRASCRGAIVAGRTYADYLVVIDSRRGRPGRRRMAALANVTGIHVIGTLARRFCAVVALDTVSDDTHVIEICRNPGHSCMAVIAVITAGDMGWVFAGRDQAVMA